MLKLSITGDTANRLGFNTLQRFAHISPQDSIASLEILALPGIWEQDDWDIVFRKCSPLNPRIGRYTYIILHLLAHPGRGHTNYSTKPEPILACGCTRKLLDMRIWLSSLSLGGRTTSGAPPWISHACSHCTSPPFKPNLRPGSSLSYLGPTYYFVTHLSQWTLPNPRLHWRGKIKLTRWWQRYMVQTYLNELLGNGIAIWQQ